MEEPAKHPRQGQRGWCWVWGFEETVLAVMPGAAGRSQAQVESALDKCNSTSQNVEGASKISNTYGLWRRHSSHLVKRTPFSCSVSYEKWNHHCSQIIKLFQKVPWWPFGITQSSTIVFCVWLLPLGIMLLRSIFCCWAYSQFVPFFR